MALITGTGGGDEERDMVMAIDQWQRDVDGWMAMKILNRPPLPAPQPPATSSLFSLGNLFFILFNCGVGTLHFGGYRVPL